MSFSNLQRGLVHRDAHMISITRQTSVCGPRVIGIMNLYFFVYAHDFTLKIKYELKNDTEKKKAATEANMQILSIYSDDLNWSRMDANGLLPNGCQVIA